ncbi:ABC transporter substrate-binding protein [Sphingobium subterraneum]|uniref:Iron complex transport system substrate-binding protein n=1 Tax=Sphingobium subterraneum TaxID=627688 RepID=A0A841J1J0_9SPHN|nr:helical backbone metal receptor [Sphingobium subterraneum]MBB6122525.1 iron complex transport system substrate-binding protein [Sphingobium subterraneum]
MRFALLFLAFVLAGCGSRGTNRIVQQDRAVPQRIVSMNPCVDAVLMEIADPATIAGISHYSQDPRATSIPLDQARRFSAVSDEAEDIVALRPDLVIAGSHVSIQTIAALKRLGIPLMQLGVPASVAEDKAQISMIAARIGRKPQGERLNAAIARALAAASPPEGKPISAMIWQSSGLVPGTGTLADDLLTRTGFSNESARMGLHQWDILPLEDLLTRPPPVLLSGTASMDLGDADANRMLNHPALRMAGKRIRTADYPANLLHCGGPVIIRAAARLATIRRNVQDTTG